MSDVLWVSTFLMLVGTIAVAVSHPDLTGTLAGFIIGASGFGLALNEAIGAMFDE